METTLSANLTVGSPGTRAEALSAVIVIVNIRDEAALLRAETEWAS